MSEFPDGCVCVCVYLLIRQLISVEMDLKGRKFPEICLEFSNVGGGHEGCLVPM